MDKFVGKWQMFESDNFEEYMKKLGVGFALRKLANTSKPVQDIEVTDGETYIKSTTTFKTSEIRFKLDEEFEEVAPDSDKKLKSIVKKESDDKFVQVQKREKDNIITRELVGDVYVMTLEYDGETCIRKYKKI